MFLSMMLSIIVKLFIVLDAAVSSGSWPGVYQDSHWKAQLCCDLTSVGLRLPGEISTGPVNVSSQYQCHVQNFTNGLEDSSDSVTFSENCLDIRCWLDDKQENVICYLKHHSQRVTSSSELTVSLRPVMTELDSWTVETNQTLQEQCAGEDEISCSTALHPGHNSVSLTVNGSFDGHLLRSPEMYISTDQLRMLEPPFDLHYNVTTEGEVMITWNDSLISGHQHYYEIRYSSNTSFEHWEVLEVQNAWVSLSDLSSGLTYTVQVRSKSLHHLHYWSNWSQTLYLTLDVSYIPAEVFTKPNAEVTVYGVFHNRSWSASKAAWMLNGLPIPDSQYRVVNERVSAVTISSKEPGFDTLMCCYPWGERYKCSIAYAKVYIEGFYDANITCQTSLHLRDSMTCKWNKSAWAVVRFLYRSYKRMCEDIPYEDEMQEESTVGVEECPDGSGDFCECTLHGLSLFSCYKLWLVVEGGHNKVRSHPVLVSPLDYVKPTPPSDLEALTFPNKTLIVRWKRPYLPAYDLQYKLRYVPVRGMVDLEWKVFDPLFESWAAIPIKDPCLQYKVEVRCRRLNGSGYWSDWSDTRISYFSSIKAPEIGPDFWRIIQEDPAKNYANVTLLFKPGPVVDPASCVQRFVVVHQATGGVVWSDEIAFNSYYMFQWKEEVHTITVMSRNSLGSSAMNNNMTLVRRPKRQCVSWFHAASNATCVSLSWTLMCDQLNLLSFVVEWRHLNGDASQGRSSAERVEWLRVPPSTRDHQLCGHFYGTEEFRLYPVFVDGEGEPVRCTTMRSDPAAYMLLMIIAFLSVVLFVTLIISQNQLRKLMWKDVPNPNNCTWAKEMDFKKMNGTENLFGHPEGLTACPLLAISESVCEVEIVEKLLIQDEEQKEEALHHSVGMDGRCTNLTTIDGSLEPLSLDVSTGAATPETSGQSSVTYSTVLVFDQPVLLRKQQESLSSSSDEGNFTANNSDISGSFPGNLWELDNLPSSDVGIPRNSCSYNSVEEFSETSEHEDEVLKAKELYYMGMNEKEDEDDEEETLELHSHMDEGADSSPELDRKDSRASDSSCMFHRSVPPYLPQFRTAANQLIK